MTYLSSRASLLLGALPLILAVVPAAPASAARLVDVAKSVGIYDGTPVHSFGSASGDYDFDGDTDLFISYHTDGGKLWRNDGGKFTRVHSDLWRLLKDRHGCTWGDVNGDGQGWLDLYCAVGRTGWDWVKDDQYDPKHRMVRSDNELWVQFKQKGKRTFTDVGTARGVGDPYGRGRIATFINANGDHLPDLFVGNEVPRPDTPLAERGPNRLFINNGELGFRPAPEYGLDEFLGTNCAQPIDYDKDGWQDLFVCGSGDSNRSTLYRNIGGQRFEPVMSGINTETWYKDADFGDLNNDGLLDIILAKSSELQYQLNVGQGQFGPVQKVLIKGSYVHEIALGDIDGDGDLDIYALRSADRLPVQDNFNRDDFVFLNNIVSGQPTFGTKLDVPAAGGSGDTVEAIDYDNNGRMDFIVLNGRNSGSTLSGWNAFGPVQLITYRP